MNELQEYTASIPDSNPNKAELIRQWKIENKWGQQEVEEVIETPIEEVKTNGAAETDAAVVPTPVASESSSSGSGESASQEPRFFGFGMTDKEMDKARESQIKYAKYTAVAQPGESISVDEFDYKYDINDEGKSVYSYKPKGSEEWKQHEMGSTGEYAIASEFGHSDFNKEKFFKQKQKQEQVYKDFNIGDYLNVTEDQVNSVSKFNPDDIKGETKSGEFLNRKELFFKNRAQSRFTPDDEFVDDSFEDKAIKKHQKRTLDSKLTDYIVTEDLNKSKRHVEFKDQPYTGKYKEDFREDAAISKVNYDYKSDLLKSINGFDYDDFLGYMNSKGYSNDYLDAIENPNQGYGIVQTSIRQNIDSEENPDTAKSLQGELKNSIINQQRSQERYLDLYIEEQEADYLKKLYSSYIKKNPEEFKDVESVDKALLKAKNYFDNKYGKNSYGLYNYNSIKEYKDLAFPELSISKIQDQAERDQTINKIKSQENLNGDLYLAAKKASRGYMSGAEEIAFGIKDLLGIDNTYGRSVKQERDISRETEDVRYQFVTGKEAEVDGITYIKDEAGAIYDVTNKVILGTVSEGEFEKINKSLDESEKTGSSFSGMGSLQEFAGVSGRMAYDVIGTSLTGGASKALGITKLASAIRIPAASVGAMGYYGASGYFGTKQNTYDQFIEAGINSSDADEMSDLAARYGAAIYSITSVLSPNSKYVDNLNKNLFGTASSSSLIKNAIKGYSKKGVSGAGFNIFNSLKRLKPTKQGAVNTVADGVFEVAQEFTQQGIEVYGLNSYLNSIAGKDVLQQDMTMQDSINLAMTSFGSGSAFANLNFRGLGPRRAEQQLQSLYQISLDLDGSKEIMNQMVANGDVTQEQVSKVLSDVRAVNNQMSNIPNSVSSETQLESAIILQEIADLQNRKKNMDEAFHENIDIKIENKREALAEIVKPELEKSISRKGSKAKAAEMDVEFLPFGSQEEIDVKKAEIIAKGGKVIEDVGYGQSLEFKEDGVTKKVILINDQVSAEDNVYTSGKHETLHPFWEQALKGNPELAIKFGKSLMLEFLNNKEISGGAKFLSKFQSYVNDSKYSAEDTWSEVIPLMSEYLSSGDIQYNPKQEAWYKNIGKKISNFLKNPTNKQPLNLRFDTGKDVFDFIVAYNKSTDAGKGWSAAENKVRLEGAKGALVDDDLEVNNTYVVQEGETIEDVAEKFPDITLKQLKQLNKTGGQDLEAGTELIISAEKNLVSNIDLELNKQTKNKDSDVSAKASKRVYQEVESMKLDLLDPKKKKDATIMAAYSLVDEAKRRMRNINLSEDVIDDIARTFALDEKRGLVGLIDKWTPDRNDSVMGYLNAKSASGRSLFDARLQEFYEADPRYNEIIQSESQEGVTEKMQRQTATEQDVEVPTKPVTRKIKPSSFISNEAVTKIKEQVQEKIKGIDPKNLTFKKLGDLAPEIIAAEIGIEKVKKLTSPTANLSKGDATAIQQFVNKNADKLLKILPEGAVVEAATEKLLGTSTGVPKSLLNAFYTKQARLGKGAGLAPFKLNKGISKADFLEAFGIVEGKKAKGFDARSPQAQALKGIASLYGKLVTNEIVRSDTDLSLEVKQDVAAGKNKAMASKRLLAEANIKPGLVDEFLKATSSKGFNDILEAKLKDKSVKQPWKSAATEYFKENPIEGLDLEARRQVISEISSVFSMKNEEVAVKRFSDRSFKELKNIIDESLASDLSKGYTFDTVDLITGDKTYRADERSLEGLNRIRVGVKILVDALAAKGFNKQQIETALYGGFITPANIGGFRVGKEPTSILLTAENLGEKTKTSRGSMAVNINDFRNNFLKGIPEGEKIKTKKETYSKDYWTNPKSKFNKLDQAGKLEFLQDLFNEGSKVKLQLADLVETISELDVAPEVTRYMITQLFADMSALGKRASGTRYVLTGVDGKMFSFKELEKLGLTRPDGDKGVFEHTKPANRVAVAAYAYARTGDAKAKQEFLNELETFDSALITEQMDDMLRNLKLQSKMGLDYKSTDNPMLTRYKEMVSDLSEQGVFFYDIKTKKQITPLEALSDGLVELEADDVQSIKEYKEEVKVKSELVPGKVMASKRDSDLIPDAIKYDRPISVKTAINALEKTDKALELARKLDQPVKKIRVFDFDDTLARTKSNVLYTMPDGTTGAIDAATFAKEAGNMEAEGAQWDFSEFSKVMQGSKGPLLDVAKIIADKRGTKDVFVLTARPADAAGPIKEFLASMGLDIPLANITGLGDGTPQAKAGWIMGKAAEGYNDFYFADDHTGNVKAVKDVLSQIDVKSKVQLAKASKRQTFDTVVNDMIEDSSGIETYKKYSAARAKTVGASKGKYNFLIPASAEDFTGLLYKMLGKGKKGDAQMAFLKTNLLDTYNRAESAVTQAKISAANDFVALKTKLKTLPKTLSKETGIGKFTYSHAVRVAAWTKQGMDIPGLSKRDVKELVDFVNKDAKLRVFTDELIKIQKGKEYPKPGKDWLGGNITTDIMDGINKVNRAEYQQEWRENIDIIFSEDNMNKMEAAYGSRWREAMEDSIRRMKSGSNRPIGGNRVTEGLLNWLNNSVGAVMFLNTRSALLQTISAVNFINLSDNNIVKAGAAFANQKQFWGDFMTLMNSDYLVERRNGLKINVSESEIADAVRESKNKPKAAIAFLLSKGFVLTRFADSFAIAAGGSTFYRNRLKSLLKSGMDQKAAEAQAFADFKAIAETSQQSSSPSKISQQQASAAGRVILAWANTPMQYARIQKRAAQDLINGRGDWRTNVSKIVYYGAIQNLIFNSLQQAVFALGFGDDEEETDEAKAQKRNDKAYRIANGMIDSQLKGLGIFGSATAAIKNTLMTLYEEHGKKGSKYEKAIADLESFSPPLGSKISKIRGGLRSASWNKKDMKEKGFSLDNPAYMAGAQVVTGLTNVPLDRVVKKINNLRGLVNERSSRWQKVALGLGWSTWELGLGYYGGFDKEKPLTPKQQLKLEVDTMKKDTSKSDQVKTLLDFGLTKKQIRELKNENNRVKKILELQKKDKNGKDKS